MVHAQSAPPKQSEELQNAFYDDWKRQEVDAAKKRAVAQYVDYDTFKNMVSVAHLKPIGHASAAPGAADSLVCHASGVVLSLDRGREAADCSHAEVDRTASACKACADESPAALIEEEVELGVTCSRGL